MVFAAKRRGRVCSGAALAVLVALFALALLSRVDAQTGSRRERIGSELEKLSGMVVENLDASALVSELERDIKKAVLERRWWIPGNSPLFKLRFGRG